MLTLNRLVESLDYHKETGHFFWKIDGGPRSIGKEAGSVNRDGYVEIGLDGKVYKAHRLAWLFVNGQNARARIDHKNGVKSDNRIANLREADGQQNAANRMVCGRSGVKGVYQRGARFVAGIKIDGRRIHIGSFHSKDDAAAAYLTEAKKHFGDFASQWIAPEIMEP